MGKWGGGLEKLWDYYDDLINALPNTRRVALETAAERLKKEVGRQIDMRLPNRDMEGRVKSWQEVTMGTRGGYAKVSPRNETVHESKRRWFRSSEKYSSKQITRWLEKGHKMVLPAKARKGWLNSPDQASDRTVISESTGEHIVPGYMFYSWAEMDARKLAYEAAEDVLDRLSEAFTDYVADYVDREG